VVPGDRGLSSSGRDSWESTRHEARVKATGERIELRLKSLRAEKPAIEAEINQAPYLTKKVNSFVLTKPIFLHPEQYLRKLSERLFYCDSPNFEILHPEQYLRKLSERLFYCDSPNFEMRVCVFAHLLTSQIANTLLGNLTKRKNIRFVLLVASET